MRDRGHRRAVVEGANGGLEGPVVALEEEGRLVGGRRGDCAERIHQRLRLRGRRRVGGISGGHLGCGGRVSGLEGFGRKPSLGVCLPVLPRRRRWAVTPRDSLLGL